MSHPLVAEKGVAFPEHMGKGTPKQNRGFTSKGLRLSGIAVPAAAADDDDRITVLTTSTVIGLIDQTLGSKTWRKNG